MKSILEQFKQILITVMLLALIMPAISQVKSQHINRVKHPQIINRLKQFTRLAAQANVDFVFPEGFKEVTAPKSEDFPFDYAMELPGKDFEIWLQIKPEKESWANYVRTQSGANPDSLYITTGATQATTFTGEQTYFVRNFPPQVLTRYNADAGKSYLLTLLDLPETKHYKYALLITLQKNHTGTIMAVCFTNEKGPEFFKNMNMAANCVKFK